MSDQTNSDQPYRTDRLIAGYFEDTLGEGELADFYELLGHDAGVREIFSQQAALHGVLTWMHQQRTDTRPTTNAKHSPQLAESRRIASGFGTRWMLLATLAASLALFVTSLFVLNRAGQQVSQPPEIAVVAQTKDPSVARIVRKVDCDWESDRWGIISSSELLAGQTLTMARGLMELEFVSGVRVTLEAPVSFTVESPMRGVLAHGKLTAQVPESARGFTIETPRGETVDLGTEFGMFVRKNGTTETHVFDGEVVVLPAAGEAINTKLNLTEDMAVRLNNSPADPDSFASVPNRFLRLAFEREEPASFPAVDRELALWLAADQRLQIDEDGRVAAWGDILTASNKSAQNAWQIEEAKRPVWTKESIGGKPAVSFGLQSHMITTPIELGVSQTVVVVFKIDMELYEQREVSFHGRQLLNLNGPPHLTLRINEFKQLVSQVHTGAYQDSEGNRAYGSVGKTVSSPGLSGKPMVAVSVYDPATSSSRLYVDGIQVDEAEAPRLKPTNSPRSIGAHPHFANSHFSHFFGDIAELMIFDVGLEDAEARALSQALMNKYGISTHR